MYAIIDDSFSDPVGLASKVLSGGCRLIQLRSKQAPINTFLDNAIQIKALCEKFNALFIVNDRIDVALACNADGAHLGQDDLPFDYARRIGAKDMIIGVSTHNPDQAQIAARSGADYIGFGPVFQTTTKPDAEEMKGLSALSEVARRVDIPVVAIGGVNQLNVDTVFESGATAAAMISDIATSDDALLTVASIVKRVKKYAA